MRTVKIMFHAEGTEITVVLRPEEARLHKK